MPPGMEAADPHYLGSGEKYKLRSSKSGGFSEYHFEIAFSNPCSTSASRERVSRATCSFDSVKIGGVWYRRAAVIAKAMLKQAEIARVTSM